MVYCTYYLTDQQVNTVKKNKTKHSVTGNWGFRKNNDQRSLSWWLLLNDFVQMQQSVDRRTTFIHQLLTQRVSLCSAVSTLHSHSTYGEISSWHRRRSNAHDIRDLYNITFCCSRLRPPSSSIFFPILNLKRLKALLINRCKSSLWKKNWIIFNFVDFFVRNEDYKQFGIGLTKSGTLAPPSWTKTTQTKMYFSLLQQLTWSNFKQWTRDWSSWHMEKIFGYQQGSHQSNVVGGGNSPVGLVSG